MKKLMIAFAIAVVAVCSQASTTKWGLATGNKISLDGVALASQTVQLYIVGVNDAADVLFDERTTLAGGGAGRLTSSTGTMQAGYDYNSTIAGGSLWTKEGGDLGREYYIVINAKGTDGKDYTYTSSAVASSGLTDKSSGVIAFTFNDTKTDVAGTKNAWVAAAVPEPTSGLLLLLGVAGLALKRRRA